jgi:hypothetical protein
MITYILVQTHFPFSDMMITKRARPVELVTSHLTWKWRA